MLVSERRVTLAEAAQRVGVTAATLRRWLAGGLVPQYDGTWTTAAIGQARVVAKMRERGHSLAAIRRATEEGRLALGFLEELFPTDHGRVPLARVSAETGLEPALVRRLIGSLGLTAEPQDGVSEAELWLLREVATVLSAGFPLIALLQLVRVYGQAMARVADAEVRLFHLHIHEPLMRSGASSAEIAEEMSAISSAVLPQAGPVLERIHRAYLRYFVEQDIVGHMEAEIDADSDDLGRMRISIAFADLAGYTRLTEEEGEATAVDVVERFIDAVQMTLPEDARVVKTIGDEVMIVASDPGALTDWAVTFQSGRAERPLPRIAVHHGAALFRDGDYYGRDINIASRVAARSGAGEVLVTRPVVDAAGPFALQFERIGEVRLKGFMESTEVFIAVRATA